MVDRDRDSQQGLWLQRNCLEMLHPAKGEGAEAGNTCEAHNNDKELNTRIESDLRMAPSATPYHHTHPASATTVYHSWMSYKMQTVYEEGPIGKYRVKRRDKNKDSRGLWSFLYLQLEQTLNPSPCLSQININPHSKGLFITVLLPITCLAFNKRVQVTLKSKMKQSLERKNKH